MNNNPLFCTKIKQQNSTEVGFDLNNVQFNPINGTTNQQRLKSHVQQFVNKMRNESDVMYQQFVRFCKQNREIDKWNQFHQGIGQIFEKKGDLLQEVNTMLHPDFQYKLPEQTNNLKQHEGEKNFNQQKSRNNNAINSGLHLNVEGKKYNQELMKQKFEELCKKINQNYPEKMEQFVSTLKNQANQEDKNQSDVFINSCSKIFGQNHPIYCEVLSMFKEENKDQSLQLKDKASNQKNAQNKIRTKKSGINENNNQNQSVQSLNFSAKTQDIQENNQIETLNFNHDCPQIKSTYLHYGATKNENVLMSQIEQYMDVNAQNSMIKLLFLYTECIITSNEMIEMGSILLQGFQKPQLLIEYLKDLIECRQSSRRKQNHNFKPLIDIDFSNCERYTHSYVKMPPYYPINCSCFSELSKSVLNTHIITVPMGSEHVTFSIMRKNIYEEQLFKSEDEKYEFDFHIQILKRAIKLLEQISLTEDVLKQKKLLEQVIELKVIQYLYKNGSKEQLEICDLLQNNPKQAIQYPLTHLKQKLEQILEAKNGQIKKQWGEISEKNFHRSLDHRSFIFKRHDKKYTQALRFEKEAEFRNKVLCRKMNQSIENKEDFSTNIPEYFNYLNSFEGITNIEKCQHEEDAKIEFCLDTLKKQKLPIMVLKFGKKNISEDALSILMHYLQYVTINQIEKEKIKKMVQTIMKKYFNLTYQNYSPLDITQYENKIIKLVTDIENKIFEKVQSYLKTNKEDECKKDFQEQFPPAKQTKNLYQDSPLNVEKNNNEENNENIQHSNSSLSEFFDEDNKKNCITTRQMSYKYEQISENEYLPLNQDDFILFFGNKHLYIFIRFFYILYERLYKAFEISEQFEDNSKTSRMTMEEKQELSKERYNAFKNILIGSFKQKETKYEDYLRSIFGKQAFLLFTIDKTLLSTVKSLQQFLGDELNQKVFNIQEVKEQFSEEITYSRINKAILDSKNLLQSDKVFFRFTMNKNSNILYVNYVESPYKDWNNEQIIKQKKYFQQYLNENMEQQNKADCSQSIVYLSRNKAKNLRKIQYKQIQIYQTNGIEFYTQNNENQIVSANSNKEDVLISSQKLNRKYIPLKKVIQTEYKKVNNFNKWYEQKVKLLICNKN